MRFPTRFHLPLPALAASAQALIVLAVSSSLAFAGNDRSAESPSGFLAGVGMHISNPSFEANGFNVYPGYARDNAPVSGWTGGAIDTSGLNPINDGQSPFADNGAIPHGNQVGFLQSIALQDATLSTQISDLSVGAIYRVSFRANARSSSVVPIRVELDGVSQATVLNAGAPSLSQTITPVGGLNPYHRLSFVFTATAPVQTLTIVNEASGDHTVLVDDFRVVGDRVFGDRFVPFLLDFESLAQGYLAQGSVLGAGPFQLENQLGSTWAIRPEPGSGQALWLGYGDLPTVGDSLSIRLVSGGRFELTSFDYRAMNNTQSDGIDLFGLIDGQAVAVISGLSSDTSTWQSLQPDFGVPIDEIRLVASSVGSTSFLIDNVRVRPVAE